MSDTTLKQRVKALAGRKSKSPSHVEELRSAVVRELEDWQDGLVIAPVNLLLAVERYDQAKGGLHARWPTTPPAGFGISEKGSRR